MSTKHESCARGGARLVFQAHFAFTSVLPNICKKNNAVLQAALGSELSQTFINYCTYRQFEMEILRSFQACMKRCGTTGSRIVG